MPNRLQESMDIADYDDMKYHEEQDDKAMERAENIKKDVKDYLEKVNKWDRYIATPNNNHIVLKNLRKKYGEDVVQLEINKQKEG